LTRSPGAGGESAFQDVFAGFGVVGAADALGVLNASGTASREEDFSVAIGVALVVSSGTLGKLGVGSEDVEMK